MNCTSSDSSEISSCASRRAVSHRLGSLSSLPPPGKLTSRLCDLRWAARRVKITCSSPLSSYNGTSTADRRKLRSFPAKGSPGFSALDRDRVSIAAKSAGSAISDRADWIESRVICRLASEICAQGGGLPRLTRGGRGISCGPPRTDFSGSEVIATSFRPYPCLRRAGASEQGVRACLPRGIRWSAANQR